MGDVAHEGIEAPFALGLRALVAKLHVAQVATDRLADAAGDRNRHVAEQQHRIRGPHRMGSRCKLRPTVSSRSIAARAASSRSLRESVPPPGMLASWSLRTNSTAIRIAISRTADSSGTLPEAESAAAISRAMTEHRSWLTGTRCLAASAFSSANSALVSRTFI